MHDCFSCHDSRSWFPSKKAVTPEHPRGLKTWSKGGRCEEKLRAGVPCSRKTCPVSPGALELEHDRGRAGHSVVFEASEEPELLASYEIFLYFCSRFVSLLLCVKL